MNYKCGRCGIKIITKQLRILPPLTKYSNKEIICKKCFIGCIWGNNMISDYLIACNKQYNWKDLEIIKL